MALRATITRGVSGASLDGCLPSRYVGLADGGARGCALLTVVAFPAPRVVTGADAARALRRLGALEAPLVVFAPDATLEAREAFLLAGARVFTERAFGWTDDRYASIRRPRPR